MDGADEHQPVSEGGVYYTEADNGGNRHAGEGLSARAAQLLFEEFLRKYYSTRMGQFYG